MDWYHVLAIVVPLIANVRETRALRREFHLWSSRTNERVSALEDGHDEMKGHLTELKNHVAELRRAS